jgi:hypothetical protein
MNDSDELLNTLRQLEVKLHDPAVRSSERASQLLADDFVEFGSSGRIYAKATILALLATEAPVTISASQFSVRRLGTDTALLTYVSRRHASTDAFYLRSSIWQLQNDRWRIVFHQGTPCAQPPEHIGL